METETKPLRQPQPALKVSNFDLFEMYPIFAKARDKKKNSPVVLVAIGSEYHGYNNYEAVPILYAQYRKDLDIPNVLRYVDNCHYAVSSLLKVGKSLNRRFHIYIHESFVPHYSSQQPMIKNFTTVVEDDRPVYYFTRLSGYKQNHTLVDLGKRTLISQE
jgi:hypothetical protein